MSNKISLIGKIWIIFVAVFALFGMISCLKNINEGFIYIISFLACLIEIVVLIFLLKGKGILFYSIYCGCYFLSEILSYINNGDKTILNVIGFILGIAVNLGLTYFAAKNTFQK